MKEAHYRKYPDWKWGSRESKKSSSGEKKLDQDMPGSYDESIDAGSTAGMNQMFS